MCAINIFITFKGLGFLGSTADNLSARQETLVWFLGQEDILEKGKATHSQYFWASLVAQLVKNTPAIQETWVWFLSWEDPPEKGTTTHSSSLAWRIPWTI